VARTPITTDRSPDAGRVVLTSPIETLPLVLPARLLALPSPNPLS